MLPIELSPATIIVALAVLALAFLAARRLHRNGTCDCHKDAPRTGSCAGSCPRCAGCPGCGADASRKNHCA